MIVFPEYSHIMMFARSVGDRNPIYRSRSRQGHGRGSYCSPTLVQSSAQFDPDYVLRPKIGAPWFGSGKNPGLSRVPAVAVTAAASTLSSTTSITAILRPGMC